MTCVTNWWKLFCDWLSWYFIFRRTLQRRTHLVTTKWLLTSTWSQWAAFLPRCTGLSKHSSCLLLFSRIFVEFLTHIGLYGRTDWLDFEINLDLGILCFLHQVNEVDSGDNVFIGLCVSVCLSGCTVDWSVRPVWALNANSCNKVKATDFIFDVHVSVDCLDMTP